MAQLKGYQEVISHSFKVSMTYLKNIHDSEDISQQVAMLFYLSKDKISPESQNSWIHVVTKNKCLKQLDLQKKNVNFDCVQDFIPDEFTEIEENIENIEPDGNILLEYIDVLKRPDKKLFMDYVKAGQKIKALCKQKKLKYDSTKKKIFRIKKDLKARYFMEKGMIGTKNILSSKLQENIQNFIKVFRESISNNSLPKMRKYFGRIISENEIPKFNISEVIEYDVKSISKNTFRIYVYFWDNERMKSLFFDINVDQNQVKITELPCYSEKVNVYDVENTSDLVLDQFQEDKRTGVINLNQKQIIELLPHSGFIEEYYIDDSEPSS